VQIPLMPAVLKPGLTATAAGIVVELRKGGEREVIKEAAVRVQAAIEGLLGSSYMGTGVFRSKHWERDG